MDWSSAQARFHAAYERTRNSEKELDQPDSHPTHSHGSTRLWPSKEIGSGETPSLASNGTHSVAKRGGPPHAGGIWASFVRGCAAR